MKHVSGSSSDVVVIGAGPAGITAAWKLLDSARSVTVVEASGKIGGLARSFDLWGWRVDLGPHRFFSSDPRVNSVWLDATGPDYAMVDRTTRILYRGKFYDYPLRPTNALANLGLGASIAAVASYVRAQVAPPTDTSTFEGWVTARFGRRLYETFFKTYSEKLWGIPCSSLDSDFAAQRIKGFSLGAAIRAALRPSSGRRHKTLVDRFAYPARGSGAPYENMAADIERRGGAILLDTRVERVIVTEGRCQGVALSDGRVIDTDDVISSMPLTALVDGIRSAPQGVREAARKLRFRNTLLVYVLVDAADLFPDQWIYVHDPRVAMGRLTNFANWHEAIVGQEGTTVLAAEYWANDDEPLWNASDDVLLNIAARDLDQMGLISGSMILAGHVERVHRCYPVYARGYREPLRAVEQYVDSVQGLHAIGRYGAFKYNNQDHSILMGVLAAENVARGNDHDLWAVNTDYDAYQESGRIDESGLGGSGG